MTSQGENKAAAAAEHSQIMTGKLKIAGKPGRRAQEGCESACMDAGFQSDGLKIKLHFSPLKQRTANSKVSIEAGKIYKNCHRGKMLLLIGTRDIPIQYWYQISLRYRLKTEYRIKSDSI